MNHLRLSLNKKTASLDTKKRDTNQNTETHEEVIYNSLTKRKRSGSGKSGRELNGHENEEQETKRRRQDGRPEEICRNKTKKAAKSYRCENSFKNLTGLKCHQKVHGIEKQFICDYCKKEFPNARLLVKHIKVHNNCRPFSCSQCDKTYTSKSGLDIHILSHTGELPFKCSSVTKLTRQGIV